MGTKGQENRATADERGYPQIKQKVRIAAKEHKERKEENPRIPQLICALRSLGRLLASRYVFVASAEALSA